MVRMRKELIPTCDPTIWTDMDPMEQLKLKLKSKNDPNFFWKHPALGNQDDLWPSKVEMLDVFYKTRTETGERQYRELIEVAGRGSGKTAMAALINMTEVYRLLYLENPAKHYRLTSGSEIFCLNVAPKLEQAIDTVFAKSKEYLCNSPFFLSCDPEWVGTSLKFPKKNVIVKALGSNSASGVGRNVKCFVADEVSKFIDNENKRGAREVYNTLAASTQRFAPWREDINVAISSPQYHGDFITARYLQAEKEQWKDTLLVWKPTWELNPNYTEAMLAELRQKDPEMFDREFGANPSREVELFFHEDLYSQILEDVKENLNWFDVDGLMKVLSEIKASPDAIGYIVATDPAALNDAFGFAVGYWNAAGEVVIQGTFGFKAPNGGQISTAEIKEVLRILFERLPVQYYIFDIYMHSELADFAREWGIHAFQHHLKVEDWLRHRENLRYRRTKIPNHTELMEEYAELLLIKNSKVDHPVKGSKDIADAVCQLDSFVSRSLDGKDLIDRKEGRNTLNLLYSHTY